MCEGDRLFGALDWDPCIPNRLVRGELDLFDLQTADNLFDMPMPTMPQFFGWTRSAGVLKRNREMHRDHISLRRLVAQRRAT
jgi:hypothetical protein